MGSYFYCDNAEEFPFGCYVYTKGNFGYVHTTKICKRISLDINMKYWPNEVNEYFFINDDFSHAVRNLPFLGVF